MLLSPCSRGHISTESQSLGILGEQMRSHLCNDRRKVISSCKTRHSREKAQWEATHAENDPTMKTARSGSSLFSFALCAPSSSPSQSLSTLTSSRSAVKVFRPIKYFTTEDIQYLGAMRNIFRRTSVHFLCFVVHDRARKINGF